MQLKMLHAVHIVIDDGYYSDDHFGGGWRDIDPADGHTGGRRHSRRDGCGYWWI